VHVLPQRVVIEKGAAAEGAVRVRGLAVRLQRLKAGERLQLEREQPAFLQK